MNLAEFEDIGSRDVNKLARVGIKTPMGLLKKGYTPDLRKKLAQETGISEKKLLDWIRFADLLRVEGIGLEYADLLREIGIDSSEALAIQNAKSLAERLKSSSKASGHAYRLPGLKQIMRAIKSASKVKHGPYSLSGDISTNAPPPPPVKKAQKRKRTRKAT